MSDSTATAKPRKPSETRTRVITAVVGLLIVLPIITFGGRVGMDCLCLFAAMVGADEFAGMAFGKNRIKARVSMILLSVLVYASVIWQPEMLVFILLFVFMFAVYFSLIDEHGQDDGRSSVNQRREQIITRMPAGLILVVLPIAAMAQIRGFYNGLAWIILILGATWFTDAGAYFVGRALSGKVFGENKMAPNISPKKTWEGFFGGIVFSLISSCVIKGFLMPELPWIGLVILAIALAVSSVVGDLAMSILKRAYGVKDTGWILPGHGGLLDRIDALLFTMPMAWAAGVLFFNVTAH